MMKVSPACLCSSFDFFGVFSFSDASEDSEAGW